MMKTKELSKLIYELSSSDEKQIYGGEGTHELVLRFEKILKDFDKKVAAMYVEYGDALELIIKESDRKVDSHVKELKERSDSTSRKVESDVSGLELRVVDAQMSLRTQLSDTKVALEKLTTKFDSEINAVKREAFNSIQNLVKKSEKDFKAIETRINASTKDIVEVKSDLINKFSALSSSISRGGAANRQMLVDGSNPLTRYTDINMISGTGMSISAANDNTNKRVDITFTASASGSGYQDPVSGIIDGVNKTFVWAVAPKAIVVDNGSTINKQNRAPDSTVNWTGTTTTVLTVAPTFNIFAVA